MKRLSLFVALALAGLMFIGTAEASAQKKKEPVLWAADDIKWEPIPNSGGAMVATLWGSQAKGPYGALTKFPAGYMAPMHYHTNATRIVVIKGAYTYQGKHYGPGSYLDIPAKDQHISGGIAESETIFFLEQSGKFDLVPVEPPAGKK